MHRSMNNILKIFKRDLKRLLRNRAAVLVIGGVCLLPSLYAWFNIDANMDPYGNTQGIKIAVANCDEGASTAQMTLDAGETIIENLKENKQLGWTFVDEDEAKEGVKSGEYYAAIVIPENFSDSLLSILSGDIKKPELDYYINEKKNAIAPKITDTGATTLQQQINDTFSSVASEAISEVISSSAGNLTVDVDQTNSELLQTIQEVRENLSGYQGVLTDFQDTVKQSDSLINDTVKTLDQVKDSVESVSDTLNTGADLLKESRLATGSFATQISNSLSDGESFINDAYINAAVKFGKLETQAEQITTSVPGSIDSVNELNQKNKQILDELSKLHDSIGGDSQISASIGEQITKLQQQNQEFSQLLDSLNSGNSAIADSMKNARTTRTDLEQIAGNSKNSLRDDKNSLCQDVLPKVDESLDAVASVSGNFSAILSGITPMADQLKAMLQQLQTSLDDSVNALTKTGEALEKVDVQLASTATDVQALQSSEADFVSGRY